MIMMMSGKDESSSSSSNSPHKQRKMIMVMSGKDESSSSSHKQRKMIMMMSGKDESTSSSSSSSSSSNNPHKQRKMMTAGGSSRGLGLSELPKEIMEQIVYRVGDYVDYVRLRAVSKSWRSMLPERPIDHHQQQLLPRQHPWLVLQSIDNEPVNSDYHHQLYHGFFSFSEKKIHRLLDSIITDRGLHLVGSSHGWLITVAEGNYQSVLLLNPISRHQICLPPLTTLLHHISEMQRPTKAPENLFNPYIPNWGYHTLLHTHSIDLSQKKMRNWFLTKIILTSNPTMTSNATGIEFMVIAILFTNNLALFNSEDGRWILIDLVLHQVGIIKDVVHINGKIYILNRYYRLYVYDINSGELRLIIQRKPKLKRRGSRASYLVEMCGELLLVIRRLKNHGFKTMGFELLKVDAEEGNEGHFVELKSLGDRALFLAGGTGSSFSFVADEDSSNVVNGGIIKRNCIYFENFVFNLEDGSITTIPFFPTLPKGIMALPLWVIPNP